jgi:hypothetical protein
MEDKFFSGSDIVMSPVGPVQSEGSGSDGSSEDGEVVGVRGCT